MKKKKWFFQIWTTRHFGISYCFFRLNIFTPKMMWIVFVSSVFHIYYNNISKKKLFCPKFCISHQLAKTWGPKRNQKNRQIFQKSLTINCPRCISIFCIKTNILNSNLSEIAYFLRYIGSWNFESRIVMISSCTPLCFKGNLKIQSPLRSINKFLN